MCFRIQELPHKKYRNKCSSELKALCEKNAITGKRKRPPVEVASSLKITKNDEHI